MPSLKPSIMRVKASLSTSCTNATLMEARVPCSTCSDAAESADAEALASLAAESAARPVRAERPRLSSANDAAAAAETNVRRETPRPSVMAEEVVVVFMAVPLLLAGGHEKSARPWLMSSRTGACLRLRCHLDWRVSALSWDASTPLPVTWEYVAASTSGCPSASS